LYRILCKQIQNVSSRAGHQQQAGVRLDQRPQQRGDQGTGPAGTKQEAGVRSGTRPDALALVRNHRRPPPGNRQHLPLHKPSDVIGHPIEQSLQCVGAPPVRRLAQGDPSDFPERPHTPVPLPLSPHHQQEPPL